MRVYLGSDHAGLERKNAIIQHLRAAGHETVDCGAHVYDALDDYPDEGNLGIVLGGSGNGEQIAANKVYGARCALAWNVETAQLARQHNHAQLIGLGGRMHSLGESLAIVDAFLAAEWSNEERHQRRIDTMSRFEETGVAPALAEA